MILVAAQGFDQIVRAVDGLKDGTPRAAVRALNRGIASARTSETQNISIDTGLKAKDVRDALTMRTASVSNQQASLSANTKRIPLIKFGAKGPIPSRGKGKGVSYAVAGRRTSIPDAFIATMPSGHQGVFVRAGAKVRSRYATLYTPRLPIRELFGPSVGRVFVKYRPEAIDRAEESFMKSFDHEMSGAWNGTPVPSGDGTDNVSA